MMLCRSPLSTNNGRWKVGEAKQRLSMREEFSRRERTTCTPCTKKHVHRDFVLYDKGAFRIPVANIYAPKFQLRFYVTQVNSLDILISVHDIILLIL